MTGRDAQGDAGLRLGGGHAGILDGHFGEIEILFEIEKNFLGGAGDRAKASASASISIRARYRRTGNLTASLNSRDNAEVVPPKARVQRGLA